MANKKELRDLFKGIADAIRTKEGSTELISAKEFPQRISNLAGGGGSSWRYFDVSGLSIDEKEPISYTALMSKIIGDNGVTYIDSVFNNGFENAIAVAFDGNAKIYFGDEVSKEEYGEEPVTMNYVWEHSIKEGYIPVVPKEITEEEFYNVN